MGQESCPFCNEFDKNNNKCFLASGKIGLSSMDDSHNLIDDLDALDKVIDMVKDSITLQEHQKVVNSRDRLKDEGQVQEATTGSQRRNNSTQENGQRFE